MVLMRFLCFRFSLVYEVKVILNLCSIRIAANWLLDYDILIAETEFTTLYHSDWVHWFEQLLTTRQGNEFEVILEWPL